MQQQHPLGQDDHVATRNMLRGGPSDRRRGGRRGGHGARARGRGGRGRGTDSHISYHQLQVETHASDHDYENSYLDTPTNLASPRSTGGSSLFEYQDPVEDLNDIASEFGGFDDSEEGFSNNNNVSLQQRSNFKLVLRPLPFNATRELIEESLLQNGLESTQIKWIQAVPKRAIGIVAVNTRSAVDTLKNLWRIRICGKQIQIEVQYYYIYASNVPPFVNAGDLASVVGDQLKSPCGYIVISRAAKAAWIPVEDLSTEETAKAIPIVQIKQCSIALTVKKRRPFYLVARNVPQEFKAKQLSDAIYLHLGIRSGLIGLVKGPPQFARIPFFFENNFKTAPVSFQVQSSGQPSAFQIPTIKSHSSSMLKQTELNRGRGAQILVGNLNASSTEVSIKNLFEAHYEFDCSVQSVKLMQSPSGTEAVITLSSAQTAQLMLLAEPPTLKGKQLTLAAMTGSFASSMSSVFDTEPHHSELTLGSETRSVSRSSSFNSNSRSLGLSRSFASSNNYQVEPSPTSSHIEPRSPSISGFMASPTSSHIEPRSPSFSGFMASRGSSSLTQSASLPPLTFEYIANCLSSTFRAIEKDCCAIFQFEEKTCSLKTVCHTTEGGKEAMRRLLDEVKTFQSRSWNIMLPEDSYMELARQKISSIQTSLREFDELLWLKVSKQPRTNSKSVCCLVEICSLQSPSIEKAWQALGSITGVKSVSINPDHAALVRIRNAVDKKELDWAALGRDNLVKIRESLASIEILGLCDEDIQSAKQEIDGLLQKGARCTEMFAAGSPGLRRYVFMNFREVLEKKYQVLAKIPAKEEDERRSLLHLSGSSEESIKRAIADLQEKINAAQVQMVSFETSAITKQTMEDFQADKSFFNQCAQRGIIIHFNPPKKEAELIAPLGTDLSSIVARIPTTESLAIDFNMQKGAQEIAIQLTKRFESAVEIVVRTAPKPEMTFKGPRQVVQQCKQSAEEELSKKPLTKIIKLTRDQHRALRDLGLEKISILQELKQEYKLDRVSFGNPSSENVNVPPPLVFIGPSSGVKSAVSEMSSYLKTCATASYDWTHPELGASTRKFASLQSPVLTGIASEIIKENFIVSLKWDAVRDHSGVIRFRVSALGDSQEAAQKLVEETVAQLRKALQDVIREEWRVGDIRAHSSLFHALFGDKADHAGEKLQAEAEVMLNFDRDQRLVVIVGKKDNVAEAKEQMTDILDKSKPTRAEFCVDPVYGLVAYMVKEKFPSEKYRGVKIIWHSVANKPETNCKPTIDEDEKKMPFGKPTAVTVDDDEKKDLSFEFNGASRNRKILIKGCLPQAQICSEEIQKMVQEAIASLAQHTVSVNYSFWQQFLLRDFGREVRNKYFVSLEIANLDPMARFGKSNLASGQIPKERISMKLDASRLLKVCFGDLLNESTDAIVNPANGSLQHSGGAALAIATAAGPAWVQLCKTYLESRGNQPLAPGTAVTFPAGNLTSTQKIINAVGPVWRGGLQGESELLSSAVRAALLAAHTSGLSSVAIPAISSGIFGYPVDQCAKVMLDAVVVFFRQNPTTCLVEVHFTNNDEPTTAQFVTVVKEHVLPSRTLQPLKRASSMAVDNIMIKNQWFWHCKEEDHTNANQPVWIPYDPDQNAQIERAINRGEKKVELFGDRAQVKNGQTYEIDLAASKQKNIKTGFTRDIKKQSLTPSTWKPNLPAVQTTQPLAKSTNLQSSPLEECASPRNSVLSDSSVTVTVNVIGLAKNVLNAIACISKEELAQTTTQEVPLNLSVAQLQEVEAFAQRLHVCVKVVPNKISLRGLDAQISKVKCFLFDKFSVATSNAVDMAKFPEWQATPDEKITSLIPLQANSEEWKKVEVQMKTTMPQTQILKIERVQSQVLWNKYCVSREMLKRKNGKAVELQLFHGTRANAPQTVYEDENGFDMRFCVQGAWGRGSYFASAAQYSHSYAYTLPDGTGTKQMFLVDVLVGDVIVTPADSSLIRPPEKKGQKGVFYDSVAGNSGVQQTLNYIIYENGRAYPKYLISYR